MRMVRTLDCFPMTREQVYCCCHLVRACKSCCNTCKDECNLKHECEFRSGDDWNDSVWWNGIAAVFDFDYMRQHIPERLIEILKQQNMII